MPKKASDQPGQLTKHGYAGATFQAPDLPDYVVVELRYESPIAFTSGKFAAPADAARQADALNSVLEKYDIAAVRSHFGLKAKTIRARVEVAEHLPPAPYPSRHAKRGMDKLFIQSGFVQVIPKRSRDAEKIAKELKVKKAVWDAYVAPRPVPAMPTGTAGGSRLFEPAQGYLHAAPNGIGAMEAWGPAGADGSGITVCDIEGNWNLAHEDLPAGITLIGGTPVADQIWRDHGTAVLGEMVSQPNSFGTVGVCHQAKAVVQSLVVDGVMNTAGAISNATSVLKAGDVILIELQDVGPNGYFVAMQYWSDTFSAIRAAIDKGITVVEAAGNGNENFDLAIYNGTGLQQDSGAIVVGAGVPPTNHVDFTGFPPYAGYASLGAPRSRMWFSNYGKIVNLQGWGWHVSTLGYGDAQGGGPEDQWYTLRFSGTSSASPIVTGAVACLQGRAKAKNGAPLSPAQVRQILIRSGTPQQAGPGVPLTQRIGPLPNLPAAMKQI